MRHSLCLLLLCAAAAVAATPAKIVLVAGNPSHGAGAHEYNAGMLLLAKCLRQNPGIEPVVVKGGWPQDESVLEGARAIVFYADGGPHHPFLIGNRMETVGKLLKQGAGLGFIHYALEIPKDSGGPNFLGWAGGYYETGYSRNPVNELDVKQATPAHPVSRGWKSFHVRDEWYYRIRFQPEDARVTPILTAMLPKDAPTEEKLSWVVEREGGGRSFGFTGGHFHKDWGLPEYRQLVMNAILWISHMEVPGDGAKCVISDDDLTQNLDEKKK